MPKVSREWVVLDGDEVDIVTLFNRRTREVRIVIASSTRSFRLDSLPSRSKSGEPQIELTPIPVEKQEHHREGIVDSIKEMGGETRTPEELGFDPSDFSPDHEPEIGTEES